MIPVGYCQCGCGEKTAPATRNDPSVGIVRGQPNRFVAGHNSPRRRGAASPCWKGGRYVCPRFGYAFVHCPGHPSALANGYAREHILVAERAIGRLLPDGAVVHHINGVRTDNRPANLVVCEDQSYHSLLHVRAAALQACGNPSWRRCFRCKEWGDPATLNSRNVHIECASAYERIRTERRRAKRLGVAC